MKPLSVVDIADIPIWDKVTELGDLKYEEVRWAIPRVLPRAATVLVAAAYASYKSWMALDWAIAVASGTEWAGMDIAEPLPVLYLDRENGMSMVAERRDMLMGLRPLKRRMTYWGEWVNLPVPTIGSDIMKEWASLYNGLIIFDTLTRFHRSKENDNMAMARVMEPFKDLARCGATVVILHHRGKSSEAEFRGAEDIVGAVDVAYSLVRDEDSRHQVTLKQIKNRFAPESSQSLVLVNGVFQRAVTP